MHFNTRLLGVQLSITNVRERRCEDFAQRSRKQEAREHGFVTDIRKLRQI